MVSVKIEDITNSNEIYNQMEMQSLILQLKVKPAFDNNDIVHMKDT